MPLPGRSPSTPRPAPAAQPVALARLGGDGSVFGHTDASGGPDSLAIETINYAGAKWMSMADSLRSALDAGSYHLELTHTATPADVHFAEFHNFMLHQQRSDAAAPSGPDG